MATPVKGVDKIQLEVPTETGAMPAAFTNTFGDIKEESASFNIPAITKNKFRVEDRAGIRYILPGADDEGATFAAQSIDIDGKILALLTGGTWTEATKTFTAPIGSNIVYLAIQWLSNVFEGQQATFMMPKAAITFNFDGAFTKGDFVSIGFEGEAMTPVDAEGASVPPWSVKFTPVV